MQEAIRDDGLVARVREMGPVFERLLREGLGDRPYVGDIRGRCMMLGIELVADRESRRPFPSELQLGRSVCRRTVRNGVWIRPLGDVIILMPPLIATEAELEILATVVTKSIKAETANLIE